MRGKVFKKNVLRNRMNAKTKRRVEERSASETRTNSKEKEWKRLENVSPLVYSPVSSARRNSSNAGFPLKVFSIHALRRCIFFYFWCFVWKRKRSQKLTSHTEEKHDTTLSKARAHHGHYRWNRQTHRKKVGGAKYWRNSSWKISGESRKNSGRDK